MFMHMKPPYTAKKKKKSSNYLELPFHCLHIFLLLNTITVVCWTKSTRTLNLFKMSKFEKLLDENFCFIWMIKVSRFHGDSHY